MAVATLLRRFRTDLGKRHPEAGLSARKECMSLSRDGPRVFFFVFFSVGLPGVDMAMGHNLCLHGADEHPCTSYFDVHQG